MVARWLTAARVGGGAAGRGSMRASPAIHTKFVVDIRRLTGLPSSCDALHVSPSRRPPWVYRKNSPTDCWTRSSAVGSRWSPTRQLDHLRATGSVVELELHVPTLLDAAVRDGHVTDVVRRALDALRCDTSDCDVVIRTSRALVTGTDADTSLVIACTVSAALVDVVREVIRVVRPAFVLAKGGITSSDTATDGLGIRRAWARGTMLPGIVSLWEPAAGAARAIPYVVFAGSVGDDRALAAVVTTLRGT